MLGWFILLGIIAGFMIGTYYLYHYWTNFNKINDILEEGVLSRPKPVPKLNRKAYELAYQKNTDFRESEENDLKPRKVHEIYAFHHIFTPEDNEGCLSDDHGKEELIEEELNTEELDNDFDKPEINEEGVEEEQEVIEIQDISESEVQVEEEELSVQQIQENSKGGLHMPELQQVGGLELIKTPVVIGENVVQTMEVSDLPLVMTAIKVRDINATITELITDVITDKVIIQGIIHKQIFFVGTDNVIHHQAEDVEFSTFVDVPGAEPGMDVLVEPTIEHIVSDLILDGNVLHQKVVLQFFVKVLSVQQLIVETGTGPLVKVERVIGENSVQTMINNEVTLAVPAVKIVDVTAEVIDLVADVIEDKVIIQGVIHKQLFYIGTDDIEHHQAEDIPFSEFVEIPGAEPGMNVQVHPNVEHIKQELSPDGTTVSQEIVLELFVKVTETVQINVATGDDSLVMLPEVIGENTKQILSETTVTLDQPAIKIKEIDAVFENLNTVVISDKVIVQGIIRKQIFFISEDNVELHQEENVPFSTFVEITGARPGMNVDVIPEISFIKPILSPAGDVLTQKVIGDIFVKVTENIQFNVNEVGPYGV